MSRKPYLFQPEPVFRLMELEHVSSKPHEETIRQFVGDYIVLIVIGGSGALVIDGRPVALNRGKLMLLVPAMLIEIRSNPANPLRYYRIAFQALRETGRRNKTLTFAALDDSLQFPVGGELPDSLYNEALRVARLLHDSVQYERGRNHHEVYGLFHRLLALISDSGQAGGRGEAEEALRSTISYIETHYQEEVTRDTLAGIAGMSPWHYSRKFKELTGQSPSEKLESVRIGKAKEHLLRLDCSIPEVAQKVGYRDESYFRNKFKASTGYSPTMFVARRREKIAALSYHYASHLLTLNVVPFATYVEQSRESHRKEYHESIVCHLKRSKTLNAGVWEANLQALARAKPEVILCDELMDEQVRTCLEKIAPIVSIPWLELDWRSHFEEIAAFLGKRRESSRWLSVYERKAEQLRKQLRSKLGRGSVAVLHIMAGQLFVYGARNGGSVLYEDLQMSPVCDTSAIQVCKQITEEELLLYDGDRIFMAIDADEASRQCWDRIRRNDVWASLQAVREGRVHFVKEFPWLEYSPYAHSIVLDEAAGLLV
ncbi:helix-turn-helix domain-containing protein [Cohnella faecalis]|uniref:Helix-turn-helix domain-containing protein n=1 Tax=Cohnella faecalis TaxID=2315694 RepID=A0A398CHU1_9BACL|nr:helix-turn-helix domain-containing protein [Cohnella faecalis]RIE00448.1 helix-turn-helix domain-containing protein [Cohnella faecalis]